MTLLIMIIIIFFFIIFFLSLEVLYLLNIQQAEKVILKSEGQAGTSRRAHRGKISCAYSVSRITRKSANFLH